MHRDRFEKFDVSYEIVLIRIVHYITQHNLCSWGVHELCEVARPKRQDKMQKLKRAGSLFRGNIKV